MSKKLKVMVSVLAAVLLLTLAGVGTVLAQDEGSTATDEGTGAPSFLARVAEKLGITEEELSSAVNEVRQEMRDEARLKALDKAVAEGYITQEEAGEIEGWWAQKPEALDRGLLRHTFGFQNSQKHMFGGFGAWQRMCPPAPAE